MIAAAMKAIREQPDLTPAARERGGLNTLQKHMKERRRANREKGWLFPPMSYTYL